MSVHCCLNTCWEGVQHSGTVIIRNRCDNFLKTWSQTVTNMAKPVSQISAAQIEVPTYDHLSICVFMLYLIEWVDHDVCLGWKFVTTELPHSGCYRSVGTVARWTSHSQGGAGYFRFTGNNTAFALLTEHAGLKINGLSNLWGIGK